MSGTKRKAESVSYTYQKLSGMYCFYEPHHKDKLGELKENLASDGLLNVADIKANENADEFLKLYLERFPPTADVSLDHTYFSAKEVYRWRKKVIKRWRKIVGFKDDFDNATEKYGEELKGIVTRFFHYLLANESRYLTEPGLFDKLRAVDENNAVINYHVTSVEALLNQPSSEKFGIPVLTKAREDLYKMAGEFLSFLREAKRLYGRHKPAYVIEKLLESYQKIHSGILHSSLVFCNADDTYHLAVFVKTLDPVEHAALLARPPMAQESEIRRSVTLNANWLEFRDRCDPACTHADSPGRMLRASYSRVLEWTFAK